MPRGHRLSFAAWALPSRVAGPYVIQPQERPSQWHLCPEGPWLHRARDGALETPGSVCSPPPGRSSLGPLLVEAAALQVAMSPSQATPLCAQPESPTGHTAPPCLLRGPEHRLRAGASGWAVSYLVLSVFLICNILKSVTVTQVCTSFSCKIREIQTQRPHTL